MQLVKSSRGHKFKVKVIKWSTLVSAESDLTQGNVYIRYKHCILHRLEVTGKFRVCAQTERLTERWTDLNQYTYNHTLLICWPKTYFD